MGAYFIDSSGVVKRYLVEVGSAWMRSLTDPVAGNVIHLARITGVEVIAAITRRQRAGSITVPQADQLRAEFRQDLVGQYRLLELSPVLLTRAMALAELHALRGYDAVQLAAALHIQVRRLKRGLTPLTLISADAELNTAAAAEGLPVDDPNAHP